VPDDVAGVVVAVELDTVDVDWVAWDIGVAWDIDVA